jgi:hypothetical protein
MGGAQRPFARTLGPVGSLGAVGSRSRPALGRAPCPDRCRGTARHRLDRPAQAHPPATLAHFELPEAGRPELGHEGRQELDRETVDGRVVGRSLVGVTGASTILG